MFPFVKVQKNSSCEYFPIYTIFIPLIAKAAVTTRNIVEICEAEKIILYVIFTESCSLECFS
jgi:hypothetical protein